MNNELMNIRMFQSKMKEKKCLIIGDIMLDRYIIGSVNRISPEAPIPVIQMQGEKNILGGSANVANNVRGYHIKTYLCGLIGKDSDGAILQELFAKNEIDFIGLQSVERPTTTKIRITDTNQQMVRIDKEETAQISNKEELQLIHNIEQVIRNVQVIILSDYAKGVCTKTMCKKIIDLGIQHKIPVIVDPKKRDWSAYRGASLITPNFMEFKEACGETIANDSNSIDYVARKMLENYNLENILVTRSMYGMTLISKGQEAKNFIAVAQEVYDVSGAGDTVVASIASIISAGYQLEDAVEFSDFAAGLAVSKRGTAKIEMEDVILYMSKNSMQFVDKIKSQQVMISILENWRDEGHKIVFTNGCFDILHVGHVCYLDEAKKLGDKLVVGLNTDHSVKRLKGEQRPINKEVDRAILIAALQSVDMVVFFDEDTPYNLIKIVQPDVLVKGGDYKKEDIVGLEFAKNVQLMPFIKEYSTTSLLNRIGRT